MAEDANRKLREELDSLNGLWKQSDHMLLEALNPGVSTNDLEDAEDQLGGLKLAQDVKSLYRWHNGSEDMDADIGTGFPFIPLGYTLSERDSMLEALGEDEWSPAWLPIFGEADEGLFALLGRQPTTESPLYFYNLQDEIRLYYESVLGMVRTVREATEQGIIPPLDERPEEFYEVFGGDAFEAIRNKHNPGAYPFVEKRGVTAFDFNDEALWP